MRVLMVLALVALGVLFGAGMHSATGSELLPWLAALPFWIIACFAWHVTKGRAA